MKAILTIEENKAWEKAFEYYLNSGYSGKEADENAWKDLEAQFPRLKDFTGAELEKQEIESGIKRKIIDKVNENQECDVVKYTWEMIPITIRNFWLNYFRQESLTNEQ